MREPSGEPGQPELSYQPRQITFLDLWTFPEWKLKAYGISFHRGRPSAELVARARELTETTLKQAVEHYGVGFVGVHEGKTAHFVFVDWWARENELNHQVFIAPLDDPLRFENATASGVMACVWDLAVIAHERDAWVDCVMKSEGPEGLGAYLDRRLEGMV